MQRRAETLEENYTELSKCFSSLRKRNEILEQQIEIAMNFIKAIQSTVINDCDNVYIIDRYYKGFAKEIQDQITALEQKDVK